MMTINHTNSNSQKNLNQAFIEAIRARKVDKALDALRLGADIDALYNGEWTAEMIAAGASADCLSMLIKTRTKMNKEPSESLAIWRSDSAGNTAAIMASFFGQEGCLRLLISHGARITEDRDEDERDCLMTAAMYGYKGCVEALLEAGAEVGARDVHGNDALDLAMEKPRSGVVELLRAHMEARVLAEAMPGVAVPFTKASRL